MTLTPAKRKKVRETKLKAFDPDKKDKSLSTLFGLPFETDESELIILPVPWDVTSEKDGPADAPEAILEASRSISLYHPEYDNIWKKGIAMHNIPQKWKESSYELRKIRNKIKRIQQSKLTKKKETELAQLYKQINYTNLILKDWLEDKCNEYLDQKKILGILGGDKSIISGYIAALSKKHKNFGILHLDAHAGLKEKNNGFDFSHDSVVYTYLNMQQISNIILTGTRELSYRETELINQHKSIRLYSDHYLKERLFKGTTWRMMINEIISSLPRYVHISIDIDVLQHWLCPDTPMPVPGGLTYEELTSIISEIQRVDKKIIGFDISGIGKSPNEKVDWNAKVGAKLLLHLSCTTLLSHRK